MLFPVASSDLRTTLHCQWYRTQSVDRNAEIEFSVRRNLENVAVDRFVWYVPEEDMDAVPEWLKGEVVKISGRLTYGAVLRNATDSLSLHILINTDIVVPSESVRSLRVRMMYAFGEARPSETIVCLTRWESSMATFPAARRVKGSNSQDLWAWWGNLAVANEEVTRCLDDIPLGIPGCDNRVAHEFGQLGTVLNPALTIRTYHIHASAQRTYSSSTPPIPRPWRKVELVE